MSADPPQRSNARRVLKAFGLLAAVAAVGFLLYRGVLQARGAARFALCRSNLKQINLALHNYHDTHGCFPPAVIRGPDGKPWHSWRVMIAPYLEKSPWYARYRFDEPWDGPNNRKLAAELGPHPAYRCPADTGGDPASTSYLAVVGDGTMWPLPEPTSFGDDRDAGTLLVVETTDSGIHWMEPRDLRLAEMSLRVNGPGESIRSRHPGEGWTGAGPGRANVTTVDRRWNEPGHEAESADPLQADMSPGTLKSLLLRDDGGPKPEEWP